MKTKHSIEKPGWELVAKYLAREANTVEKETVEKWASQSDQNNRELLEAKILLEKADDYFQLKRFDSNIAWEKTQQQIHPGTISIAPPEKQRKALFQDSTNTQQFLFWHFWLELPVIISV
jgi:hypothetical protein